MQTEYSTIVSQITPIDDVTTSIKPDVDDAASTEENNTHTQDNTAKENSNAVDDSPPEPQATDLVDQENDQMPIKRHYESELTNELIDNIKIKLNELRRSIKQEVVEYRSQVTDTVILISKEFVNELNHLTTTVLCLADTNVCKNDIIDEILARMPVISSTNDQSDISIPPEKSAPGFNSVRMRHKVGKWPGLDLNMFVMPDVVEDDEYDIFQESEDDIEEPPEDDSNNKKKGKKKQEKKPNSDKNKIKSQTKTEKIEPIFGLITLANNDLIVKYRDPFFQQYCTNCFEHCIAQCEKQFDEWKCTIKENRKNLKSLIKDARFSIDQLQPSST